MDAATIYTISDARDGYVYYVGATKQPLKLRLSAHLSNSVLPCLRIEGFVPKIEPIETVDEFQAGALEGYWIEQFKQWGFKLQNRNAKNVYRPFDETGFHNVQRVKVPAASVPWETVKDVWQRAIKRDRMPTQYLAMMAGRMVEIHKLIGEPSDNYKLTPAKIAKLEQYMRDACPW